MYFHPTIKPYTNSFASIVAGILGWRLFKIEEFEELLRKRGGNDRVALASEVLKDENKSPTFSFSKSVGPLVTGSVDHHKLLANLAQQLLGHCWEVLREAGFVPKNSEPVLEFYRHVRNGCFHANKFHFQGNQPKYRAEWRRLRIKKTFQGNRIFRTSMTNKNYFLNWGRCVNTFT